MLSPPSVSSCNKCERSADLEGSTALTERLGDTAARELLREHERITREALKAHGGAEIKTMGDGFMASFGSATQALECAMALQRAFATHNETAAEPVQVRVGMNAGEPIEENEDLFGTTVNMAARIAGQAKGGEIFVSDVVRQLVAGKGFSFVDRGDTTLKGFGEPIRLYESLRFASIRRWKGSRGMSKARMVALRATSECLLARPRSSAPAPLPTRQAGRGGRPPPHRRYHRHFGSRRR